MDAAFHPPQPGVAGGAGILHPGKDLLLLAILPAVALQRTHDPLDTALKTADGVERAHLPVHDPLHRTGLVHGQGDLGRQRRKKYRQAQPDALFQRDTDAFFRQCRHSFPMGSKALSGPGPADLAKGDSPERRRA